MYDPRGVDRTPLNAPDVGSSDEEPADASSRSPEDPESDPKLRELMGDEPREDQDAFVTPDQIGDLGAISDTEIYEGEIEAGVNPDLPTDDESLDMLTASELRAGETEDPGVAAEEGEAWVPPTDPPVIRDLDDPQGAQVAAGFGQTSLVEPYDADHHGAALEPDDEVTARVREALRADARTSTLADRVGIETVAGTVIIRGTVDDVEDAELLAAVASDVTGVGEVRDETELGPGG